jgi:hypothetical protein
MSQTYSSITQQQLSLSNPLLTLQASDISVLLNPTVPKNYSNPNAVNGLRWITYTPTSATSGTYAWNQARLPNLVAGSLVYRVHQADPNAIGLNELVGYFLTFNMLSYDNSTQLFSFGSDFSSTGIVHPYVAPLPPPPSHTPIFLGTNLTIEGENINFNGATITGVYETTTGDAPIPYSQLTTVKNTLQSAIDANTASITMINDAPSVLASFSQVKTLLDTISSQEVTDIASLTTSLTNYVNTETSRATTAEALVQSHLDAEVTRAQNAEAYGLTHTDAETTRATGAESALRQDLNNEVARALTAEQDITNTIDAFANNFTTDQLTVNTVKTANGGTISYIAPVNFGGYSLANIGPASSSTDAVQLSQLQSAVSDEQTRAMQKENSLTSDLASEAYRATTAETALQQRVTTLETSLANLLQFWFQNSDLNQTLTP